MTIGQTHSLATHRKFYALKRRRIEEAKENEQIFQTHFNEHPLPSSSLEEERNSSVSLDGDSEILSNPLNSLDSSRPSHQIAADQQREEFDQLLRNSNYSISNIPTNETLSAMKDLEFGIARNDLDKKAKRFEWIKEELDYLVFYIQTIEGETTKNRYANCLNHLKTEASADIKKYFHPHHVASSDRLKNGFNVAMKQV